MPASVEIKGLKEFARELGKFNPNLRKELGQQYKGIGSWLVPKAQSRMAAEGKGRGGTLGQQGIKASARTTALSIILSGTNPRTLGDEFGALAWRQFRHWTGSGDDAGYAVWPTIREQETEIERRFADAVERAASGAFPD